jgi:uncharacterized protein (TIGR02246 family)
VSDVIDRVVAALNAGDVEAFVACYAPDATIENGHDDVRARGHDELRARFGPMFEAHPDVRVEPVSRVDVGEFVVQHERVTGRGAHEVHVAVYLVQDGLISRERLIA